MAKKRDFQHESLEDHRSISAYLKALVEGFESKTIRFADEDGSIVLEPKGLVSFEVRASEKRGREDLTLRFSWRAERDEKELHGGILKINGDEDASG